MRVNTPSEPGAYLLLSVDPGRGVEAEDWEEGSHLQPPDEQLFIRHHVSRQRATWEGGGKRFKPNKDLAILVCELM